MPRLVVLAPNWLGDAIMALPLIADLRRAWPEAPIIVAARAGVAPLFQMVPAVNDTLTLDRHAEVQRLGAGNFDAAILLPNSFAAAWMVRRARIPERWGFSRDLRAPLLTKAVKRPRRYGHQAEYYQALGNALGAAPGPLLAAIDVPRQASEAAARLLGENGIHPPDPFVVAAPGAAYGRAKQWLPARFAELATRLAGDGTRMVVIGTGGDAPACAEVARLAPVVNLATRTDLPTLAGVMSLSRGVVANDSGAMHLAASAGVPVTAIFGPTNDQKTAPLPATSSSPVPVILKTDVWCRPCMLRECPIDHRCMTRISAEQVYRAVKANLPVVGARIC